jgi:2-polyprenyl-3-methyl-5-hydroxy-6-metoxy-1,4-benzoquinol methylase
MSIYDEQFFASQSAGSYNSASIIIPHIMELYKPKKVADVGGGVGTWCKVFDELMVDATCYDGDYAKPICKNFIVTDLEQPLNIRGSFDLVLCLEVAEHISEARADYFIKDCCSLSKRVIFSAAIVGQGGTNHINEQPHSYWHKLFYLNGYKINTDLRDIVRTLQGVEWWYSQNIFTYEKDMT